MDNTPTTIVIFGATGDLAQRKLFPALFDLYRKRYLPKVFRIVGFSRSDMDDRAFRAFVGEVLKKKMSGAANDDLEKFLQSTYYEQGLFEDAHVYERIAERLIALDEKFGQCSNKFFYLAVPPSFYETILQNLADSGLTIPCSNREGWTRVLVEKPFGKDVETAKKLDRMLGLLFREEQVFRIDHYLAKDTIQNILAFRFSNTLLEPIWNKEYIERMEIRLLEEGGVERRGAFYEGVGALRDVGQNHILQMLALVAMENPGEFAADRVREERAKVFRALHPIVGEDVARFTKRGQYKGYRKEEFVAKDSTTETYFRIEARVDNDRWKGVPFILESGKKLRESKAEIRVYFKKARCLCASKFEEKHQNVVTLRVQPNEGISILFWTKKPGLHMELEPRSLSFDYRDGGDETGTRSLPDAYEKVLYDAIRGDQTLFASTEEVEAAWKFITPIITGWNAGRSPLLEYMPGSEGPL